MAAFEVASKCGEQSAPAITLIGVSEPLEEEVLDGVPVLAEAVPAKSMFGASEPRSLAVAQSAPVQTAAVAAGSFLAGAAFLGLVRRRHNRRAALARAGAPRRLGGARKRSKQPGEIAIVGSRSLLVDVHLLGAPLKGR
jgi:hypothetical protein